MVDWFLDMWDDFVAGPRTLIDARVIADSVNPDGVRLTTLECTFNRYILAEVNTYREWSRNSASSRAIPVKKILRQVWKDPAVPIRWGKNQSGMQAREDLTGWRRIVAMRIFLVARLPILALVWLLTKVGLHKQVANRLLEPWMWHTAIITSTTWTNMLKQRDHEDAQPEFRFLAQCIRWALDHSTPRHVEWGDWHLPYVIGDDYAAVASMEASDNPNDWHEYPEIALVCAARCAAVSYVRQGEKRDPFKDIDLANRLTKNKHWSPLEHAAQAWRDGPKNSNFDVGWVQLRKFFDEESGR